MVGAWITGLIALVGSDWRTVQPVDLVFFFLFFPIGLFRALGLEGGREPAVLGWGIYLMLGVAITGQQTDGFWKFCCPLRAPLCERRRLPSHAPTVSGRVGA